VRGHLRAGYQRAAELGAWELHLGTEATLSAVVLSSSPYWMEQRPLGLELVVGAGVWKWSAVEIRMWSKTRVEISLPGKPEGVGKESGK
jgi:hypothetical protein